MGKLVRDNLEAGNLMWLVWGPYLVGSELREASKIRKAVSH